MERIQYLEPILGNTRNNFVDVSPAAPFPVQVITGSLATGAATETKQDELQGVQGTGASYDPPTGGSGLFGWLSGIFKEIKGGIPLLNGGTAVSSGNPLPVQNVSASPVDRSGTITTGGVAQIAAAALSTRKAYFFCNLSSESMWGSFTGTAAPDTVGSFEILPRGSIRSTSVCETTALSIYGATTGKKYTMWEM